VNRMKHSTFPLLLILILIFGTACGGNSDLREAQRIEAIRVQQESLVRNYSRSAGQQIMEVIGGGQDLIVQPRKWYFDAPANEFEIPMDVSFNGAVFRSNNYQVSGVLTVQQNGSNPRFARLQANENYQGMESTLTALAITAAGVMVLADMSEDSKQ